MVVEASVKAGGVVGGGSAYLIDISKEGVSLTNTATKSLIDAMVKSEPGK